MIVKMSKNFRVWMFPLLFAVALIWLLLSWKSGLFSAKNSAKGSKPSLTGELQKASLPPLGDGDFEARSNDDENDEQYEKRIVIGKIKKTYRNWHKSIFPEFPPWQAIKENGKRKRKQENVHGVEESLKDNQAGGGGRVRQRKERRAQAPNSQEMKRDSQAMELNAEVLNKLEEMNQHIDRAQLAAKLARPKRRRFSRRRRRREVGETVKEAVARGQPARASFVQAEGKPDSSDSEVGTALPAERDSSSSVARAHATDVPLPEILAILIEKVRTHVEKTAPSTTPRLAAATQLPGKSPANDFENVWAEDAKESSLVGDLNSAPPSRLVAKTADSAKTAQTSYGQESRLKPEMSYREMSTGVLQRFLHVLNTGLSPVSKQERNLTMESSFSQTDVAREYLHPEAIRAHQRNNTVKGQIGSKKPNKSIHIAEQYRDRKKRFGKDLTNNYKEKIRRDFIDVTLNVGTKEVGRDVTKSGPEIEKVTHPDKNVFGFVDSADFENDDDVYESTQNNLSYYHAEDYDENLVKHFQEILHKRTDSGSSTSSSVDDYDPIHLELFRTLLLRQQDSSKHDQDDQQSLDIEAQLTATHIRSPSGLKKSGSESMTLDSLNVEHFAKSLDPAAVMVTGNAIADEDGDVNGDEIGDAIADKEDLWSGVGPATIFSQRLRRRRERRSVEKVETFLAPTLPMQNRITITVTLMTGPAWSQDRPLGSQVELDCHNSVLAAIRSEVPTVRLQWLHNDQPLSFKPSRMLLRRDDLLLIQDLRYGDTGLYECLARYGGEGSAEQVVPAAFFALAVTGDLPSLVVRLGDPLSLSCHAHPLALAWKQAEHTVTGDETLFCRPPGCMVHNFTDRAVYRWFHNDNESDLLPGGTLDTHRPQVQKLGPATQDMAGVWRCQARHVTSGRVWNTSWYRVHVNEPPSFLERAWNVFLQTPGVAAGVGLLMLGICLVLSLSLARQAQKSDEQVEARWQAMKKRMLHRSSTRGLELATSPSLESLIGSDEPRRQGD